MPILFENIDNKQTLAIDRQTEGKYFTAKLAAVMNSSNLSPNADRGQDKGWRLAPEQQALIEQWEADGQMIDRVSQKMNVQIDALTHADFLSYLLYTEELGVGTPNNSAAADRRAAEQAYQARVDALKSPKTMAEVEPIKPLSLEEFMGDDYPEAPAGEATTVGVDPAKEGEDESVETPVEPASKEVVDQIVAASKAVKPRNQKK